jgi:phenylalanyl-tRNA synthetase beta chain
MKYSYNWLKELSGTKKSPEQLAELLTMKAFEVESVEKVENKLDGVVVGKILEINKHPNADKLQLTLVDVGDKKLSIVCGASNIKVGDKVPVALVGTKLPGNFEIKETEIRGEKSFGMLCAEDEIGLGKDHKGIIIMDAEAKIGNAVSEVLGLVDSILEIKVLPDRGHDALSHIGMAREISALEGRELKYKFKKLPNKKGRQLNVEIKNKKLCPRYIGAIMENIEIKESPAWAKIQLKKLGVNPINNVVDATNFVMLELGQPMHAFDFEKVRNGQIVVRSAKKGEKIKLLDETEKILTEDDLVIADNEKALAIAGVMGGLESGISENTKTVIMESANFDFASVRKTRMRHNLLTDAALRYEKELDPNLTELAIARVLEIIEMMGGKTQEITDVYPAKVKDWKIKLDLSYANKLLGENVPVAAVKRILTSLGLKVIGSGKIIAVEIPTFRIDLKTQEDLIEEIGRIYGYEKVESQAPKVDLKAAEVNVQRLFERKIKNILVSCGFSEVYNYSFYGERDAESARLETAKHLKLENPLNPDQALLRTSLIPCLLKNIRENLKHFKDFCIFENGRVYEKSSESLPDEKKILAGAITIENQKSGVFYDAKGYVDALLKNLGVENYYFEAKSVANDLWHAGRSAEIKVNQKTIGRVGEINPQVLQDFDIQKRIACFEFDLAVLQKNATPVRTYKAISKYPVIIRDISLMAQDKIKVSDIMKDIQKSGGALVQEIELFDIFQKENKNSFAFHIKFGADRTLESKEVDGVMVDIVSSLEKRPGVVVRKG